MDIRTKPTMEINGELCFVITSQEMRVFRDDVLGLHHYSLPVCGLCPHHREGGSADDATACSEGGTDNCPVDVKHVIVSEKRMAVALLES